MTAFKAPPTSLLHVKTEPIAISNYAHENQILFFQKDYMILFQNHIGFMGQKCVVLLVSRNFVRKMSKIGHFLVTIF